MHVTKCHLCGSADLTTVIDLGFHPLADFFLKEHQLGEAERRYPLSVLLCRACGHAMNSFIVPKETRYQENDYSYDSGNSKVSIAHFNDMARDVAFRAGVLKGELVVDIGSSVGTLLAAFKEGGAQVQGVEPAPNMASVADANGIPTINDFFNPTVAQKIFTRARAKAITITNAFNHVDYLDSFMQGILMILRDEGSFVIEFPYFLTLLKKRHFDTIYHEHVSYFSVKSMRSYMQKFGLAITHAEENEYMGGSIRFFVGKGPEGSMVGGMIAAEEAAGLFDEKTWSAFAQAVANCKLTLLRDLLAARQSGGKIVAVGAAAKGNTLLNYCGIDRDLIDFATDASPFKVGKYTPGSHLPIYSDDAIDDKVSYALILAWNIADLLKNKIGPKHPHLKFITPHIIE